MQIVRSVRLAAAAAAAAVLGSTGGPAMARTEVEPVVMPAVLIVDVAEVATPNGVVAHGFVYTEGTLRGTSGIRVDGTPEFPERVIGTWTANPWAAATNWDDPRLRPPTSRLLWLTDRFAGTTLLTEGDDNATIGQSWVRSVTGGSGRFQGARGTAGELVLGRNRSRGRNLRVTFRLVK